MNARNTRLSSFTLALPAAAALALSVAPAFAQQPGQTSRTLSVVSAESLQDGEHGKSETFEIRVQDGQISVKRNGKEVPNAQIVQKDDGRVIILGDDGEELKEIKLRAGGPGGFFYRIGDESPAGAAALYKALGAFGGVQGLKGLGVYGALMPGEDGQAPKVMIGVHMAEPGPALEKHLRLESGKCTMITGVFEGLSAEQAGIGEYDIIIAVDGEKPADAATIKKKFDGREPGESVTLRIIQAGRERDVNVKLLPYDAAKLHHATLIGEGSDHSLWTATTPFLNLRGDFRELELPEWKGELFVAPAFKEWKGMIQPQLELIQPKLQEIEPLLKQHLHDALSDPKMQQQLHEALKRIGEVQGRLEIEGGVKGGADVESQLDRLDRRMAELEKMLQQLLERQAKP